MRIWPWCKRDFVVFRLFSQLVVAAEGQDDACEHVDKEHLFEALARALPHHLHELADHQLKAVFKPVLLTKLSELHL